MCGIIAYKGNRKDAAKIILDGLRTLEYRGYDSWGVVVSHNGKLEREAAIGRIPTRKLRLPPSQVGIGHTRWATHGGVKEKNAHPFLDCNRRYALIHNGIIENYADIKADLKKRGHKFSSETDTETAVHLVEEYAKSMTFREAVIKTFNQLEGHNAIVVVDAETSTIVGAKSGSPLIVARGEDEYFLASDATAVLPYTKEVYFIEENEVVQINDKISLYNSQTGKEKVVKFETLDWEEEALTMGKFPHFMLKEIHEQPKVLKRIIRETEDQILDLAKFIKKAYGTYFIACGTASYAALESSYLFAKVAKRHVNPAVGSEFGFQLDFLTPKSLVVALSQSGETMDTIESVKKAQEKGAKIISIVNTLGSTLYRMADRKMLLLAGPEKAVASTKAFTAKLAVMTLLSYALAGKLKVGQRLIDEAAEATSNVLSEGSIAKIRKLAKKIHKHEHMYIVGRGLSHPIALEAALKIKEISYIHAEGFAAGELKHGVIALIEESTPCIAIAPKDETYGATLSGAMEMKARGGYMIGITSEDHEVFDHQITVEDCGEATAIPNTVAAQLLSYYLALERGCDIDKPRNLAKSVTVK